MQRYYECVRLDIIEKNQDLYDLCGRICNGVDNKTKEETMELFKLILWKEYKVLNDIENCVDTYFKTDMFIKEFTDHDTYYNLTKKCIYNNVMYEESHGSTTHHIMPKKMVNLYVLHPYLFNAVVEFKFGFSKYKWSQMEVSLCISSDSEVKCDSKSDSIMMEIIKSGPCECELVK